jgi:hypothetical protein
MKVKRRRSENSSAPAPTSPCATWIDWVGRDAVRFFRAKADTEFTFDVDLAPAKSEESLVLRAIRACARPQPSRQVGGDPAQLHGAVTC